MMVRREAVNLHWNQFFAVRMSVRASIVRSRKVDLSKEPGVEEMPAGRLSHLQVNVKAENLPFYKDLFTLLAWEPHYSDESTESFNSLGDVSLWFIGGATDAKNDYDGVGVNHVGLAADSQADVDQTAAFLEERGIERLFETPRHRPDFSPSEESTYYQVMFESPDGVLFEHVYVGPKQD
jgi:catechol 2,3-dioxygenase-like lactoylglutathione lyase family enzyme